MAEIWIHRKCARPESEDYAGDELILPKQHDATGIEICVICRTHTPTLGACYLHEGDEVNWSAPVEPVEVTEASSEEPKVVVKVWESPEYKKTVEESKKATEAISEELPTMTAEGRAEVEETISDKEREVAESIPEEQPVFDTVDELMEHIEEEAVSEPSVTIAVEIDAGRAKATLDELESQITELQAKKDALEK